MKKMAWSVVSVLVFAIAFFSIGRAATVETTDGYDEQLALLASEASADVDQEPAGMAVACPEGQLLWHRSVEISFCTVQCNVDADCIAGEERCRVFSTTT